METQAYTEAETARIAEYVAAGLSCTEIAVCLPGRTVSGIGWKIRHMGLKAQRKKRDRGRSSRDYMRRILREIEKDEPNDNAAQDEAFQRAMKKAVAEGLEFVAEGISTVPCTENPKPVRPYAIQFSRSPALMCFELGDNTRDIFAA